MANRKEKDISVAMIGWVLMTIGAIIFITSFFMTTTITTGFGASGNVHNIGLLQRQMMIFQTGIGFMLTGIIGIFAGSIIRAVRDGADPLIHKDDGETSSEISNDIFSGRNFAIIAWIAMIAFVTVLSVSV